MISPDKSRKFSDWDINSWAICCPGVSLNTKPVQDKIFYGKFNKIVAVNGAFLLRTWFDYWIMQDLDVFASAVKKFAKSDSMKLGRVTLLIPEWWMAQLPLLHPENAALFNVISKETFPGNSVEEFAKTMPFGKEINWRECTLFAAIAAAIKAHANIITVFGADWTGRGYFIPGMENDRLRHTEERWRDEETKFIQIKKVCMQNGIQLIRG